MPDKQRIYDTSKSFGFHVGNFQILVSVGFRLLRPMTSPFPSISTVHLVQSSEQRRVLWIANTPRTTASPPPVSRVVLTVHLPPEPRSSSLLCPLILSGISISSLPFHLGPLWYLVTSHPETSWLHLRCLHHPTWRAWNQGEHRLWVQSPSLSLTNCVTQNNCSLSQLRPVSTSLKHRHFRQENLISSICRVAMRVITVTGVASITISPSKLCCLEVLLEKAKTTCDDRSQTQVKFSQVTLHPSLLNSYSACPTGPGGPSRESCLETRPQLLSLFLQPLCTLSLSGKKKKQPVFSLLLLLFPLRCSTSRSLSPLTTQLLLVLLSFHQTFPFPHLSFSLYPLQSGVSSSFPDHKYVPPASLPGPPPFRM